MLTYILRVEAVTDSDFWRNGSSFFVLCGSFFDLRGNYFLSVVWTYMYTNLCQ